MEILQVVLSSSVIAVIVEGIASIIRTVYAKKSISSKALRLILLQELKDLGLQCIKDGAISSLDLQCFNDMYDTYKSLGGDGYADRVHKAVNNLPLKLDE